MDKLNVELGSLLGINPDKVQEILDNEEALSNAFNDFHSKKKVFTLEEVKTLKDNIRKEAKTDINWEELKGDIPRELYNQIKGSAFEKVEKDLSKIYGVSDFNGIKELVEKIAKQKSTGDEGNGEKDQLIEDLRGKLKTLNEEKESKIAELESKHSQFVVNQEFSKALNSLPLDYEESAVDKQRRLLDNAFKAEFKVEVRDGKPVAIKEGHVVTNDIGDPRPIAELLTNVAKDYDFKIKTDSSGGRGDGSSTHSSSNSIKGKTFDQYLQSKNKTWGDPEQDKMFEDWKKANPDMVKI